MNEEVEEKKIEVPNMMINESKEDSTKHSGTNICE